MTRAERIERFVRKCCEELDLSYDCFFGGLTADPNAGDMSWHGRKKTVNLSAVEYAAEILGMKPDDILHTNDEALYRWIDKYPYFLYTGEFREAYRRTNYNGEVYDNLRVLEVLFGTDISTLCPWRYDGQDINRRLKEQINELKQKIHFELLKEGKLTRLNIKTVNFCHLPDEDIREMTESFIEMLTTAKSLFIKAVNEGLFEDEIYEYNMLVSTLGIRDSHGPSLFLYYSNVIGCKKCYADITQDSFFQYIRINAIVDSSFVFNKFEPWKCAEFVNDKELVKRFAQLVPNVKPRMREYAMSVRHFTCVYSWIDEKQYDESMSEDEDDFDEDDFDDIMDIDDEAPLPDEPLTFYVDKTDEELNGDGETADKLSAYCRPVKLGGISVPDISERWNVNNMFEHFNVLLSNCKHTSYEDRLSRDELGEGGANRE